MRKRHRVLLIAAVVAAVVGRFGYARSVEPTPPVAVAVVTVPARTRTLPPVPDTGKLLLVGTLLFGLSAVVRKAS